jgi:hypothetical protein
MNPEELLKKGLSELDIPATEAQIETFMALLRELKKEKQFMGRKQILMSDFYQVLENQVGAQIT